MRCGMLSPPNSVSVEHHLPSTPFSFTLSLSFSLLCSSFLCCCASSAIPSSVLSRLTVFLLPFPSDLYVCMRVRPCSSCFLLSCATVGVSGGCGCCGCKRVESPLTAAPSCSAFLFFLPFPSSLLCSTFRRSVSQLLCTRCADCFAPSAGPLPTQLRPTRCSGAGARWLAMTPFFAVFAPL